MKFANFTKTIPLIAAIMVCSSFVAEQANGQDRKQKPRGVESFNDQNSKSMEGRRVEVRTRGKWGAGSGEPPTSTLPMPRVEWILGINDFWFDYEGLNIERLNSRSPLRRLNTRADRRGQSFYLEPGDVITEIDGISIQSFADYLYALQTAPNPRDLEIGVINCRDGRHITLYGSAMKIRR